MIVLTKQTDAKKWFREVRFLPCDYKDALCIITHTDLSLNEPHPPLIMADKIFTEENAEFLADEFSELGLETALELIGDASTDLLARLGLKLWALRSQDYFRAWLKTAQLVYTLATKVGEKDGQKMTIWQAEGYTSFLQFAKDQLDLFPAAASQLKGIWEVYKVQLGLPDDFLLAVGKSKLALMLKTIRDAQSNPQLLEELLEDLQQCSFATLLSRHVRSNDGVRVSFLSGDELPANQFIKSLGATMGEVRSKIPPVKLLDVVVDGMVHRNAVAIVFANLTDPDAVAASEERILKALRVRMEEE